MDTFAQNNLDDLKTHVSATESDLALAFETFENV
jgi:hypothetical protein